MRVEARVVQQRGGAAQPRGDEHVARRLRPARGGRAPDEVARRAAPSQCSACSALAGEVALAVQHRLRLARVPEVKVIRHGSSGVELDRGRRRRRRSARRPGRRSTSGRPSRPRRARRRCARRTTTSRGRATVEPQRAGPSARSCSVQGSTTAPMAEAGDHRQHPLGPVADQRHHDVAAARRRARRARPPARADGVGDLAEASTRARAPSRPSSTSARAAGRRRVDDVAGEVHPREPRQHGAGRSSARVQWRTMPDAAPRRPRPCLIAPAFTR